MKSIQTIHRTILRRRPFCSKSNSLTNAKDEKINILFPDIPIAPSQPSLLTELKGLPKLKPASQLCPPKTLVSTLSNGLRIISQDTYGQASTIGIFVDAGSRYENSKNAGISHLMEHICFRSTKNRSHAEIVRDIDNIGAMTSSMTGREQLMYSIDVLRDNVDASVEILSDTLLNPLLLESEIKDILTILNIQNDNLKENPQLYLQERIHEVAYGMHSSLGRSLQSNFNIKNNNDMQHLMNEIIKYRNTFFVPERMVLAGSGIEHDHLVSLANQYFSQFKNSNQKYSIYTEKPTYIGGNLTIEKKDAEFSSICIAFEAGGWHDEDLVPICVLHTLLGGGDSFSAGGPGKGMYSRLYTHVLNSYHWVESACAFNSIHTDAGLIGVYGAATPTNTANLVAVICNQILEMCHNLVPSVDLIRARNQLKSSVLMNLESRMILFEDIGRQLLTYNKREDPETVCKKIDNVTPHDIRRVMRKAVSSNPSLVYYGDLNRFPNYEHVTAALKKGLENLT